MIHTFYSTYKLRAHEILMADYFVVCNKPNKENGNKLGKQIHLQVEQKKKKSNPFKYLSFHCFQTNENKIEA